MKSGAGCSLGLLGDALVREQAGKEKSLGICAA